MKRHLISESVPLFCPHRPSSLVLLLLPLPQFLSSFAPSRSANFGSRRASFSISSAFLSGRGLSHTQAPSKTHAQFVAVGCTPVGLPSYAWCATSGSTAAAPGFIPHQTTGCWPCGAAPPRSHLLHPPGRWSPPTWSVCFRPSRSRTPSPSSPSPSDIAHLPRQAPPLHYLPLGEAGFCRSIATAFSTATQNCRTSFIITRCFSHVYKRPNSA